MLKLGWLGSDPTSVLRAVSRPSAEARSVLYFNSLESLHHRPWVDPQLMTEEHRSGQGWVSCFQFSSVVQSVCLTLWDSMNHGMPGFPVHYQLLESTQTHVPWVDDAISPSHPLLSPSLPSLNLSQHRGLFKGVSSLYHVAKILEFQLHHQSFQWRPRTDFL